MGGFVNFFKTRCTII